jgi:serine phosphatase RsbU (regulator of sigma subunit)
VSASFANEFVDYRTARQSLFGVPTLASRMSSILTSQAFEEAVLRTERLRVLGVVSILALFLITGAARMYLFGSHMTHVGMYVGSIFLIYELLVLVAVQRSIRTGPKIPDWFWTINVLIEMSLPAIGVAFLASDRFLIDYRPIATSWVLLFFPLLILITLRLSPLLCSIAGISGATGYLLAAAYSGWHIKADLTANGITHSAVPFIAIMIFGSGVLAALVAREIRTHVMGALREAEAQRQLKQMEHDLTIARSIQQSLLPQIRPTIGGYDIAGWNHPADATGGDYFDWKQCDDGRLVVTLADVTGHGIGPALLASVCRAYSRASFSSSDTLANTMQRINGSFCQDVSPGRFATFVAAVCKADDDKIELLSAGHGPLFWYSREKDEFQAYPAHDVPLGILPHLTSESSQVIAMSEGDLVILITDGFLEFENPSHEDFGIDRFKDTIRRTHDRSPEEMIAELHAAVLKFADGATQQDDLTAVVIKRTKSCTELNLGAPELEHEALLQQSLGNRTAL